MRGADWSGLEEYLIARWYTHAHFFLYPFYYIEYGFGQVAALQVYRVAGSSLIFDEQPMRELIGLVERQHLALC
jgi:hypothetical protein